MKGETEVVASTPVVQMPAGGDLSPLSDPAPAFAFPMGILAVGIEHALGVAVQRRQHSDVPSREFPIPIRPDIGALSAARLADEKRFKGDFLASMAV